MLYLVNDKVYNLSGGRSFAPSLRPELISGPIQQKKSCMVTKSTRIIVIICSMYTYQIIMLVSGVQNNVVCELYFSFKILFIFYIFILFFNLTILYWFCHISAWIYHRYTHVPHPEPSSHLPPRTIPLGRPSAAAPSIQYRALNLDWRLVSYMMIYIF